MFDSGLDTQCSKFLYFKPLIKLLSKRLFAHSCRQAEVPEYGAHGHESYTGLKRHHPVDVLNRINKKDVTLKVSD